MPETKGSRPYWFCVLYHDEKRNPSICQWWLASDKHQWQQHQLYFRSIWILEFGYQTFKALRGLCGSHWSVTKRIFSKTLFKPEEFENTASVVQCGQKTFCKWRFSKTMTLLRITMWFPCPSFPQTLMKKKVHAFQSENTVSNILRRRVDVAKKEGVCYSGK